MPPWIEYFAVAVCAISGVLAAEGKRMDLFGFIALALVSAVGGGPNRSATKAASRSAEGWPHPRQKGCPAGSA